MITKIGINIITNTAQEQDRLIGLRESRTYYEDPYNDSIGYGAYNIIIKYTDCNWEINAATSYIKDGRVLNIVIFTFYNEKGIDKKALRAELEEYVYGEWEKVK